MQKSCSPLTNFFSVAYPLKCGMILATCQNSLNKCGYRQDRQITSFCSTSTLGTENAWH